MTIFLTSVINGTIHKIDGDKDGQVDDVRISQFTFDVTAGTTVFFDSLAYEATNVDLIGDGFITGFAANTQFYPRAGHLDWAAWRVTMTATNGTLGNLANLNPDAEAAVPEPATLGLLGAGLFGVAAAGRRRRQH